MSLRAGLYVPDLFGQVSGRSKVSRMITLGLANLGIEVRLLDIRPSTYDGVIQKSDYDKLVEFTTNDWEPDICLSLAPDLTFPSSITTKKVGLFIWEAASIPPFVDFSVVDEVWVPSEFLWKLINRSRKVGKKHLAYMPLGVDISIFCPGPRTIAVSDELKTRYDFIYGTICNYTLRKGIDLILTAHYELFNSDSNVALFIKGDLYGVKYIAKDVQVLESTGSLIDPPYAADIIKSKSKEQYPVVLYSFNSYKDTELAAIYKSLDAFVFPSRGEGFGLPPIEAMSCGLPVIGTRASGMEEYMLENISYPIDATDWKVNPRLSATSEKYTNQFFVEPNYEQYKAAIQEVFSNREEAKSKGMKASEFVANTYSLSIMLERIKSRLEAVLSGAEVTAAFWPKGTK